MEAKKIVVLYGGTSAEREVSLQSGNSIFQALVSQGHQVQLLDYPIEFNLQDIHHDDFIFIALHGEDGESGQLQQRLHAEGLKFSGSGYKACLNTWNKLRCKELLRENHILTPAWLEVSKLSEAPSSLGDQFFDVLRPFDSLFLKPTEEGSSIDVFKITDDSSLFNAISECTNPNRSFVFEQSITHRELTVPILNGRCLPPIEITTNEPFYNYAAKYLSDKTKLQRFQCIESELLILESICLKTYEVLGCSGWARIDLLQGHSGSYYVLEVNTVPGMTSHSLFPKSASFAEIGYIELVQEIINAS